MITVNSGRMTIPENERFVGFAGDNGVCVKKFLVSDSLPSDSGYKLFLTFDDSTCNYFMLRKTWENGSLVLVWNVSEEHLFKSGVISAQIKAYSSSGEIYHTTRDYFIADDSAEYSEYFKNSENSQFLEYDRRLNSSYLRLEEVEEDMAKMPYYEDGCWYFYDEDTGEFFRVDDYVPTSRKIAGLDLSQDRDVNEIGPKITPPYRRNGVSASDYLGQYGSDSQSINGSYTTFPVFAPHGASTVWKRIALSEEVQSGLDERMKLAPSVGTLSDLSSIAVGQMFKFTANQKTNYYVKTNDSGGYIKLANDSDITGLMSLVSSVGTLSDLSSVSTGQLFRHTANQKTNLYVKTSDSGSYIKLANDSDLSGLMSLVSSVGTLSDLSSVSTGQLFRHTANQKTNLYLKTNDSGSYIKLANFSDIPTAVSQLANDSGYLTAHQDISNLMSLAPTVASLSDLSGVAVGQIFIHGSSLYIKEDSSGVYSKILLQPDIYSKENSSNKVTSISSASTDTQYPSAKCVYDAIPTAVSQLTNDSGYLTSHQDISNLMRLAPTVSSLSDLSSVAVGQLFWYSSNVYVKEDSTGIYKRLAAYSELPCAVSELINDSGYLTSHQDISSKENTSNKVTSISSSSTNAQYPSALAVKNYVDTVIGGIENGSY